MTAAGGTTTVRQISNSGNYTLYEIKNDSWDSGETFSITSAMAPISTSTKIIIVGAYNEDTANQESDGTLTVDYTLSTRTFGATESGASGDIIRVLFYAIQ